MNKNLDKYLQSKIHVSVDNFLHNLSFDSVVIDLFVSDVCNLKCKHCYFGKVKRFGAPLSYSEWTSTIDKFYKLGVRHFHLSGKESSLSVDALRVLKYIRSNYSDCYLGFVTNGTGSLEVYQDVLSTYIDYLEFSVDGLESIHNYIRGGDVFQILYTNISNLQQYAHKLNVTTCINKWNSDQYIQLIEVFYKLGIHRFFVTPIIEKGAGENLKEYSLTSIELVTFVEHLFEFIKSDITTNHRLIIKICFTEDITRQLWRDSKMVRELIIDCVENNNDLIYRINGNILQLSFSVVNLDYYYNLSITNDGYILPCSDDISYEDYWKHSLCNVKTLSDVELSSVRKNKILQEILTYKKD